MDKREKVIMGLECCMEIRNICWDNPKCPYNDCEDKVLGEGCMSFMMRDALALLKAQEPVEPICDEDNYIRCGKCKHHIVGIIAQDTGNRMPIQKYCAECGQAVKWK